MQQNFLQNLGASLQEPGEEWGSIVFPAASISCIQTPKLEALAFYQLLVSINSLKVTTAQRNKQQHSTWQMRRGAPGGKWGTLSPSPYAACLGPLITRSPHSEGASLRDPSTRRPGRGPGQNHLAGVGTAGLRTQQLHGAAGQERPQGPRDSSTVLLAAARPPCPVAGRPEGLPDEATQRDGGQAKAAPAGSGVGAGGPRRHPPRLSRTHPEPSPPSRTAPTRGSVTGSATTSSDVAHSREVASGPAPSASGPPTSGRGPGRGGAAVGREGSDVSSTAWLGNGASPLLLGPLGG